MNSKTIVRILAASILPMAFMSCASSEIGESKDVAQDKIYQQFNISYTQENANAEVFSQFRFAGDKGTTLVLTSPSKLELDGKPIKVDSSAYGGAFYKTGQPISSFYGKHQLVFTDVNNKKYVNDFSFDQFKLVNVPVNANKNQPLIIHYETAPLSGDDYIKISTSNTDSSFSITHNATDASGNIEIPAKELLRQKVKNLSLSATLYRKRPLQQNTAEGGILTITYALNPILVELK